ncbi:Phox-like protein [Marasmius fiardii PR-910]|nr:Phox-like protein [Marasmius fiardii PR-910]
MAHSNSSSPSSSCILSPITPTSSSHPFAHSTSRLEILPNGIDIEEELRLYDQLCEGNDERRRPNSIDIAPSIFSRESISIWLGDSIGDSKAFARDVKIAGWTNVGDKMGGAYVVYDCAIKTKEGTFIHAHKRYSSFVELESALHRTLPRHQRHYVPSLPPKAPFARYRPAFLDRRRRQLEYWLSAVLLHPDVGSSQAVRLWVMD